MSWNHLLLLLSLLFLIAIYKNHVILTRHLHFITGHARHSAGPEPHWWKSTYEMLRLRGNEHIPLWSATVATPSVSFLYAVTEFELIVLTLFGISDPTDNQGFFLIAIYFFHRDLLKSR